MLSTFEHLRGPGVALLDANGQSLSYDGLRARADRVSSVVAPRSLVFTLCSNTAASVIGYVGLLRGHAVQLLLSDKIEPVAFARLLALYDPSLVYLPRERTDLGVLGDEVLTDDAYHLVRRPTSVAVNLHDDLSLLMSTSGSTGSPKLVRLSNRNLSSNAESIAQSLGIDESERAMTTLGFSYAYGLSILNSHLVRGASMSLCDASLAEAGFWQALAQSHATSFGGVPYTFQMLKRLRFASMSLPSLRYLTQAGGRLEPELTREFVQLCADKGMRFFTMYGQTEATARMSVVPWSDAATKIGSIGKPIPSGHLRIDHGATEVRQGEGELVYEGPNVSLGYAEGRHQLELGDLNHGVLRTGDLATQDEDGFFTITGRTQRFVKVFGHRVSLDEVETLARALGFEAAVIGRDDMVVVFTVDSQNASGLVAALASRTGLNARAFALRQVPQLPRTEAGKVQYSALKLV